MDCLLYTSVLLSAQATDVSVNKATAKLYPVANTPAAMLELGVEGVKTLSLIHILRIGQDSVEIIGRLRSGP